MKDLVRPTYYSMKDRCLNPKSPNYHNYGGRGIKVCDRWLESFDNFYEDMGDRPEGTSLDRIDVNGDYTPENCRWATPKQQQNNRRNNHRVTMDGVTKTVMEWAEAYNVNAKSVYSRIHIMGWEPERALKETIIPRPRGRTLTKECHWCKKEFTYKSYRNRMFCGNSCSRFARHAYKKKEIK